LGFHDCVPNGLASGCDGCINLVTNHENKGLLLSVDSLAPIVADLESPGFSRADIWALAVLVAADFSTPQSITFNSSFRPGRKNCETVGTCNLNPSSQCASNGPDTSADFPTTILTTHGLIDFMTVHFGFTADETVALMGAHTLGKAIPTNSGYEGQNGWVTDPLTLGM
jgi:Peroxidase